MKKILKNALFIVIIFSVCFVFAGIVTFVKAADFASTNLWNTEGTVDFTDTAAGAEVKLAKSSSMTYRNHVNMMTYDAVNDVYKDGFKLDFTLDNSNFVDFNIELGGQANYDPETCKGSPLPITNRFTFSPVAGGKVKIEYSFKSYKTDKFEPETKESVEVSFGAISIEYKYDSANDKYYFTAGGKDFVVFDGNDSDNKYSSYKYNVADVFKITTNANNTVDVKIKITELNGQKFEATSSSKKIPETAKTIIRMYDDVNPEVVPQYRRMAFKYEIINVLSSSNTVEVWYKSKYAAKTYDDITAYTAEEYKEYVTGLDDDTDKEAAHTETYGYTKAPPSTKMIAFVIKPDLTNGLYDIKIIAKVPGLDDEIFTFNVGVCAVDEQAPVFDWTKGDAKTADYQDLLNDMAKITSAGESMSLPYPSVKDYRDAAKLVEGDKIQVLKFTTYYKSATDEDFQQSDGLKFTPTIGTYQIKFKVTDISENSSEIGYNEWETEDDAVIFTIKIFDIKAPTITLPSAITAYRDEVFNIPSASIYDAGDYNYKSFMRLEQWNTKTNQWDNITDDIEDNQITFTVNGKYRIVYSAIDSSGNISDPENIEFEVTDKPFDLPKILWDNIWTVVFASIAIVSLIALLLLLFIKPKKSVV